MRGGGVEQHSLKFHFARARAVRIALFAVEQTASFPVDLSKLAIIQVTAEQQHRQEQQDAQPMKKKKKKKTKQLNCMHRKIATEDKSLLELAVHSDGTIFKIYRESFARAKVDRGGRVHH